MSVEAISYVWKHGRFTGNGMVVHLAIADVVNDAHGNEFWMLLDALAEKARCGRTTVSETLRALIAMGGLEVLERGGGRGNPTRYRFLMPGEGLSTTTRIPDGLGGGKPAGFGTETSRDPAPIGITQENSSNSSGRQVSSVDNRRAPDPNCVSCHGAGETYNATGGFVARCVCVADPYYEPASPKRPMPTGLDAIERIRAGAHR